MTDLSTRAERGDDARELLRELRDHIRPDFITETWMGFAPCPPDIANSIHWHTLLSINTPEAHLAAALMLVPEGWWLAGLSFVPEDFRSAQEHEWSAQIAGPITWVTDDGFPEPQFDCKEGIAKTPAHALIGAIARSMEHGD